MAMVGMDGSSLLADSQVKLVGLVWGLVGDLVRLVRWMQT